MEMFGRDLRLCDVFLDRGVDRPRAISEVIVQVRNYLQPRRRNKRNARTV